MTDDFDGDWREYMRGIENGNVVPTLEHLQAICKIAREDHDALVKALKAACGYLMNAKIDLSTNCTKATAIRTIEDGIKLTRHALADVGSPSGGGK